MDRICIACKGIAEEVEWNDGFPYEYGSEVAYHDDVVSGSRCCGEEVVDGICWLDKSTFHVARKDIAKEGYPPHVRRGEEYLYTIKKGFYVEDGRRVGFVDIEKRRSRRR